MLSVSFPFFSSFYDLAHFLLGLLKLQADRQSWTTTPASPLTIHVDINGSPTVKEGQSLFTLQTNNNIFLSPFWCKRLHTLSECRHLWNLCAHHKQSTMMLQLVSPEEPRRRSFFEFWPARLPNVAHVTFDCSAKCRDASFKCHPTSIFYSTSIFSVPASTLCLRGLDIAVSNLIMCTYH